MRYFIIFLVFVVACSFLFQQDCEKLQNGNYKVKLDNDFTKTYGEFEFEISDSFCLLKRKDTIEHFQIQWLPNCGFRLKNNPDTPLNDFQKQLLTLGEPYYDIIKVEKDTAYFIYRVNLHIQIYSGKLIKTCKSKP